MGESAADWRGLRIRRFGIPGILINNSMKISTISIANFKSIKEIPNVPLGKLNSIIGANDAGKTSFIDAINVFFKFSKLSNAEYWHNFKIDVPIKINLTLNNVVIDSKQYDSIEIKSIFKFNENAEFYLMDNGRTKHVGINEIQKLSKNIIYLSADRANSIYHSNHDSLLDDIFKKTIDDKIFSENYFNDNMDVIKNNFNTYCVNASSDITEFLKLQLGRDTINFSFNLSSIDALNGSVIKSTISEFDAEPIPFCNWGAGTKNNAIFALLRHFSKTGGGDGLIFLIEEPENSLHIKAQKILMNVFYKLSANSQFFVSTHSPIFTNMRNIKFNILLERDRENGTCCGFIKKQSFIDRCYDNLDLVSDALFKIGSRCTILVEGPTEEILLPMFMNKLGIDHQKSKISVSSLKSCDHKKIKLVSDILIDYNIPHIFMLDKIRDGKNFQVHDNLELREIFYLNNYEIENYYNLKIVAKCLTEMSTNYNFPMDFEKDDFSNSSFKVINDVYEQKLLKQHNEQHSLSKVELAEYYSENISASDVPDEIQGILKKADEIATRRGSRWMG